MPLVKWPDLYDAMTRNAVEASQEAERFRLALDMIACADFTGQEASAGLKWCQDLARETLKS
jgi:hypothetical protein